MKRKTTTILLIVILLAGLSLLLYPTVSDYWNRFHSSRVVAEYDDALAEMDNSEYEAMLEAARAYNDRLWTKAYRYNLSDEERAEYESLLDVIGTGMMGYIEIPSINCRLPIYHGVDISVLQVAAGHVEGTSLPVGGEGTHAVLSAHRGLPSARLFTDLDKMVEGDIFVIKVLNETLTYEVDQIRIVLPDEVDELDLVEGMDYCTLVTCTPYGVNSHRILVRGHRTENRDMSAIGEDAKQIRTSQVALCLAAPVLIILSLRVIVGGRGKKRRK